MKKEIIFALIGVLAVPQISVADYSYRFYIDGVKKESASVNDGETSDLETEEEFSCFDPVNIGSVGANNECKDLLIVDNSLLQSVIDDNGNYFAHDRYWNHDNIFTGQATSLDGLFKDNATFNGEIGHWNTSNVTSMKSVFKNAISFNQNINQWDTSSVTTMSEMFFNAQSFNQPLSNWDLTNTLSITSMFEDAVVFNQDISQWNTSNLIYADYAFYSTENFNSNIGGWDVSSVTNFAGMFHSTDKFNQDISQWDMSSAENVRHLFKNSQSFNVDISQWDLSGVTSSFYAVEMFYNAQSFNQNIQCLSVPNIENEPADFMSLSGHATNEERIASMPVWGSFGC